MKRVTVGSILLVVVAFIMYTMNMLMLPELLFPAVLIIPMYLYTSCKLNMVVMWSGSWCIGYAVRYAFQYMLLYKGIIVEKPIDMTNTLVRQYAGIGMIIGLFMYATLLLIGCIVTADGYYRKCLTVDSARNNAAVKRLTSFYSVTIALMLCEIIIYTPVYKMQDMVLNMLIYIVALVLLYVGFVMFCIEWCRRACSRIYAEENGEK